MFGNNIRVIREENGLSQTELGKILHVTKQTVSNWENEKSYPDLQTLVSISDQYGISLDDMLKEDLDLIRKIDQEGKVARRRFWILCAIVLAVVITGMHLTEGGALRAAGVFYSPASMFTMVYEKLGEDEGRYFPSDDPQQPCSQYLIIEGDPYFETNGVHFPWGIYRFGPFYYARYLAAP